MILNILTLAFFVALWLMAVTGLIEASGPFMRRLSIMRTQFRKHNHAPSRRFTPAVQS